LSRDKPLISAHEPLLPALHIPFAGATCRIISQVPNPLGNTTHTRSAAVAPGMILRAYLPPCAVSKIFTVREARSKQGLLCGKPGFRRTVERTKRLS